MRTVSPGDLVQTPPKHASAKPATRLGDRVFRLRLNLERNLVRRWIRARYGDRIRQMGASLGLLPPFVHNEKVACKVCDSPTEALGSVDFNKCCEEVMGTILPRSGIPVVYRQCRTCGFMFTNAFDTWTHDEFQSFIYNEDYWIVDPDYLSIRPSSNERRITGLLTPEVHGDLLDYGGGNGLLATKLRRHGFEAKTYDPFTPEFSLKPTQKFAVITCFETLEHVPDLRAAIRDLAGLLRDDGIVIFSTFLRRVGSADDGLDWWYVAPRNGHVSICSGETLKEAWGQLGYNVGSANQYVHIAWSRDSGLLTDRVQRFFNLVQADNHLVSGNAKDTHLEAT